MKKIERLREKIILFAALIVYCIIVKLSGIHCPIKYLTGVPCPGCGMTRAMVALLRFDFRAAFLFNPMVFSLPVLAFYVLYDGAPFKNKVLNISVLSTIGAGFLINWIVSLVSHFA